VRNKFEVHYEVTVEYDSGRTTSFAAYSKTEYLVRIRGLLKDKRVKEVWVRRVEAFYIDRFLPVERD
jgi:hypothetical protein